MASANGKCQFVVDSIIELKQLSILTAIQNAMFKINNSKHILFRNTAVNYIRNSYEFKAVVFREMEWEHF